jgi:hypothetical protein
MFLKEPVLVNDGIQLLFENTIIQDVPPACMRRPTYG